MSRPRAFDIDAVTEQAMQVFWQSGYAAASMADLYAATGLKPGSVYAAFGDKERLFQRAFETYAAHFRATLPQGLTGLAAIEAWLGVQADLSVADPERKGCLIVNTVAERHAHSARTHAMAQARMDEIRAFFRTALDQAAAAGELRPDADPDLWADSLTGTVVSLMTLGRAGAEERTIRNVATAALAGLPRA
ncbi:TetR/AcrR family transcriptional regulator [Brevundimonas subvibrioides]|uniref:Regulatory protein TetR n=1 Tax=Brevundimonas subvibrioides (strain ATCC 15264 / DSM 4735 / LMG 14903 / NBRC 16000 / CB 81) TaxID=633149 RepID=D9QNE1_BRESC|nr:TetR/AcrR family transcriptional regulator [Brevundimonas subvibrioides]ADL00342.1 regulatory protein TetR [Brevundimonas subvibrioides ATCC 15264]